MRKYILLALIIASLVLAACSTAPAATPTPAAPAPTEAAPAAEETAVEGEAGALSCVEPLDECFAQLPDDLNVDLDMDCGYVVVPESRSGESDREVKLGFTRLSSGKGTANSPLFMLGGGPGGTLSTPDFFPVFQTELLGGILAERDIVMIEQRGTKHTDPDDPSVTIKGEITMNDMVNSIYGDQGSLAGIVGLPYFLKGFVEGGAEAVTGYLGAQKGSNPLASRTATTAGITLLMHMAVVCSDDPVKSVDEVKLDGAGRYATLFGQSSGAEYVQLCSLIDVQGLPDSTDVDVTLDVPTLLLSGDLDVQTPTFRSQEVADALPNATLVVFPGRTHVQIASANICAGQIMTQSVLDPMATLDTSCVAEAPVVGFVLPDGSSSKE